MSLSLMTPVDEFICVLNTALVGRVRTRAGRSHTSEASQDASGAETQNCAVWLGYFIQLAKPNGKGEVVYTQGNYYFGRMGLEYILI